MTGAALRYLYPDAVPFVDFEVSDDGKGIERIVKWNTAKLGTQPTPAQIAQASTDAATAKDAARQADKTDGDALDALIAKFAAGTATPADRDSAILKLLRALKRQRAVP